MARKPQSEQYNYILGWINEATDYRRGQNKFVERTIFAYQGKPSKNVYTQTINTYIKEISQTDKERGKLLTEGLKDLPEKSSMVLNDAVETVVSMAQGGVGKYEFGPYDPTLEADDDLIDRLSSAAKHFYTTEKMDKVAPQWIRNAILCGESYIHLKPNKGHKIVTILDSSNMVTDPKRFKTNMPRFRGHSQRESMSAVKNRVMKTKGGYVLKTINEAEVYVSQIVQELNGVLEQNQLDPTFHEQLRRDIDIFYKPLTQLIAARRDKTEGDPDYMYAGDDVEVTYLYDLMNEMYFEVINRRYIIVAKANDLKKTITSKFEDLDGKPHDVKKEVCLEDPYVALPYIETFWDAYPISPLFYILDDYDSLCAMESVLYHNLSIMAPLTFIGQSSDSEKMARAASVSGEIVEGMPQTFSVLDKTHDVGPVIAAIQRYEQKIKHAIKAYDPFEMQAMLGDRSTAKEVSAMSGQISQGLNPFLANIETAFAEVGEKFMKMEIIFGDNKTPYSFVHNGKYSELEGKDMAANYEITAKLASSIKLEQEANAKKALELIQYLGGSEDIDKNEFIPVMIPIVLNSLVSREQAEKMVSEKYRPMPEETISRIRSNEEARAKMDPVDKLDLSKYSPEELDQMIAEVGQLSADPMAAMSTGGQAYPDMSQAIPTGEPEPPLPETDPAVVADDQPVVDDPNAPGVVTIPTGGPANAEEAGDRANDPAGTI